MKMSLSENLDSFDLKETKRKVNDYFSDLETLKWQQARLNIQQGLTARYEVANEDKGQAYVATDKDEFNLSASEEKARELEKHMAGYEWAKSILSKQEQLYITEYFENGKFEDEVVGLLGINRIDSRAFRSLKRKAIFKFAYVLSLVD